MGAPQGQMLGKVDDRTRSPLTGDGLLRPPGQADWQLGWPHRCHRSCWYWLEQAPGARLSNVGCRRLRIAAVPPDVVASAAAVGHHLAGIQAHATHPAGDNDMPPRAVACRRLLLCLAH